MCVDCNIVFMRRKIPSTGWLTAFEAAARHQSYTKAAAELALTQGAVCRQIGALEDFLGGSCFAGPAAASSSPTPGAWMANRWRCA